MSSNSSSIGGTMGLRSMVVKESERMVVWNNKEEMTRRGKMCGVK